VKAYAPAGFTMAMMNAPVLPDAKPGYEKINFSVGFSDSIVLSRNSDCKELAKEFLRFMALEENCLAFSNDVPGTYLAYSYDITAPASGNVFAESVAKILSESASINIYSKSELAIKLGGQKLSPWPQNTFYYALSYDDPSRWTPEAVTDEIYTVIGDNWENWNNYI
jgi:N-acetylglucosamine transport system substrate-binding protein